jgi:hypothetical protein
LNSKCACCAKFCSYVIAALGTFLIVALLVRVMVAYTQPAPATEDRAGLRRKNLVELRNANTEVLNNANYAWQDQAKGVVRMPIKDAMELSLKMWQDKDAARSNLMARVDKATKAPPKVAEPPSKFE